MLSQWERQNDQPVTPNMPVSDIKRILPTANSRTQVWFFVQYHHHHRKYGIERSAPSGSTCLPIRQTVQMGQARCTSASRSSHDTILWEYPPASQHTSSTSVRSRLVLGHSRLLLPFADSQNGPEPTEMSSRCVFKGFWSIACC